MRRQITIPPPQSKKMKKQIVLWNVLFSYSEICFKTLAVNSFSMASALSTIA